MMEEACSDPQVFINGAPDTDKTFGSVLHTFLHRNLGLRVFPDPEKLRKGIYGPHEIDAAIKTSSVHIIIFSPRFAESVCCLENLCRILEHCDCNNVVPIFFDVQPKALKMVNEGPYAEAFIEHNANRIEGERWKKTLKQAAGIKGFVFNTEEGWSSRLKILDILRRKPMRLRLTTQQRDWGEMVIKIVEFVRENVRRELLWVADHPVGLDKAEEDLRKKICKQMDASPVTIVGIAGLDGSGKTTLVTHLWNLMRPEFKWFSFLRDCSGSKSISLQKQLLSDLRGNPQPQFLDTTSGKSLLEESLIGLSQVLIILDGMNHEEQINSLLSPVKDALGAGSLIVITSRDKSLLTKCNVTLSHDMKLLNEDDARELFCYHASVDSKTPTVSEDVVTEMVKICGGFPLALIVLGRKLSAKKKWYWKTELEKLHKNQFPIEMLQQIVKPSYASLEKEEKVVFLNLASFFEEPDFHLVVRVKGEVEWQLLDWIQVLGNKCLVEIHSFKGDFDGKVKYNNDGEHEDLRSHKKRRLLTSIACRGCKIAMSKFVKDMANIIASEEDRESQMISSNYQISYLLQKLPKGISATKVKGKLTF